MQFELFYFIQKARYFALYLYMQKHCTLCYVFISNIYNIELIPNYNPAYDQSNHIKNKFELLLRIGPISRINEWFSIHTRKCERRGHLGFDHINNIKVIIYGHHSSQCLIKYLLVILELCSSCFALSYH